jgi:sugar/nucleoside kinase (ribokinase family)
MFDGEVVVAGHCCLDVIPTFLPQGGGAVRPGTLVRVGPAQFAPGGAVSNVGLALHRLGSAPRLVGKVGEDDFGTTLLGLLRANQSALADGMVVAPGETTSYSVVINPPGVDRTFLHCPGANDTFGVADLARIDWDGVQLLHFGYPPLMARIAAEDGADLAALLAVAKRQGVSTTLDMAWPDPTTPAGQADWAALLARCLPFVDAFMPSAEELVLMLDRDHAGEHWTLPQVDALAVRCLELGAAVVAVKLGAEGLLLRTTEAAARLASAGTAFCALGAPWLGRQLLAPCFAAQVVGTTGAGDATIAGFIWGVLTRNDPATTLIGAVAVGACSVEAADASSAIPTWDAVQTRVTAGWERLPAPPLTEAWQWRAVPGIWHGPSDNEGGTR